MYRSSSSTAQDWGSVDDSEVVELLDTLGSKNKVANDPNAAISNSSGGSSVVPTDKDEDSSPIVDVPSSQIDNDESNNAAITSSDTITETWHSMSNAQFIAYVNRLGSERSQAMNSTTNGYDFHLSSSDRLIPTVKDTASDNHPKLLTYRTSSNAEDPFLPTQKDLQPPSQSIELNINSSPKKDNSEDLAFPVLTSPSHEPSSPFLSNTSKQATSSSFGFNTLDEQEVFKELEEANAQNGAQKEHMELKKFTLPPTESSSSANAAELKSVLKDVDRMPSPPPIGDDKSQQVEEELEFGDYATYFHNKHIKQQDQDQDFVDFAQKAQNKVCPPIFKGCVIYVNGKTSPDIAQLHKLIILHGGKFLAYLGAEGNATHIIAEVLTPRKRIEFRNYKVVRPAWILDSIEAGKILPWSNYMLINNDYGQERLNFWTSGNGNALELQEKKGQDEDKQREDKINRKNKVKADSRKLDEDKDEDDPAFQISQISEYTDPEPALDEKEQQEDEMMEGVAGHARKYKQLTAKDPGFLDSFFAKSRLHHLSTWKMDLRSKFLQKAIQALKKRRAKSSLPPNAQKVVIHVDFDCFFATVSALKHIPPIDIHKYPVCVTHGSNGSDIASCNYIARAQGCRNGMWLGKAKKLCPDLMCLDYNFEAYEQISRMFYDTILQYDVDSILPVSVDEALLDVSSLCVKETAEVLMKDIRLKVFSKTGCSVSCGCGPNVLLAKLCLKKAKPDGQFKVDPGHIQDFIDGVKFQDLPGMGYRITEKLESGLGKENISVGQLKAVSKERLTAMFGMKTGTTIYEYVRGIDHTSIDILSDPAKFVRKSLSININWGVRFDESVEVEQFLERLSKVMNKRLEDARMIGGSVSLKLALRHPKAPVDPAKFLGMGRCVFVSKASAFGSKTRNSGLISGELKYLWRVLGAEPKELRGIAITMSKLSSDDDTTSKGSQSKLVLPNIGSSDEKCVSGASKRKQNDLELTHAQKRVKSADLFSSNVPSSPLKSAIPTGEDEPLIVKQLRLSPKKKNGKRNIAFQPVQISRDEINWDVFGELPMSIQQEIKQELRRRDLAASPKKKKVSDVVRAKGRLLFKSELSTKYCGITRGNQPQKVVITQELIDSHAILRFQGIPISEFDTIKKKLLEWIDISINDKEGPFDEDVGMFSDLMFKLIEIGEILKFLSILDVMKVRLQDRSDKPGYAKWETVFAEFKAILKDTNTDKMFQYGF